MDTSRIARYLTAAWIVFCLAFIVILIVDMTNFIGNPSTYPIGAEGLTWKYKSELNYLAETIMLLIWFLMPCVMFIRTNGNNKKKWTAAHVLITLVYQIYIISVIYRQ